MSDKAPGSCNCSPKEKNQRVIEEKILSSDDHSLPAPRRTAFVGEGQLPCCPVPSVRPRPSSHPSPALVHSSGVLPACLHWRPRPRREGRAVSGRILDTPAARAVHQNASLSPVLSLCPQPPRADRASVHGRVATHRQSAAIPPHRPPELVTGRRVSVPHRPVAAGQMVGPAGRSRSARSARPPRPTGPPGQVPHGATADRSACHCRSSPLVTGHH